MPAATSTSSMAAEHASELVSIVATYLRKHGFAKTLSVFLRENGDAFQETDVADLETLYKHYISTQPNGASKERKPRMTKSENVPVILEGDKDAGNDIENTSASLHMNGGTSSEKKKKKKADKKNALVDLPMLEQTGERADATESQKTTKEGSKKKKGENIEGNDKGHKLECEKAFSNGNAARSDSILKENNVENHDVNSGCLPIQQELAYSTQSLIKKSKKEKKDQKCLLLQDKETSVEAASADIVQVLSQDGDEPKKKRKKSKDSSCKNGMEDGVAVKAASEVLISEHTKKLDSSKQPVNALKQSTKSVNELEGGEICSKKKKHRKELPSQCAEGSLKESAESELEERNDNNTDNMKHSGKKRKAKEYVDAGKTSNQDCSNLGSSPEKLKEAASIADKDVEMQDSTFVKERKKKDTPNNIKTPTGALAFKRVEVEKVDFLDPRLSDNSYWAKDGAEEGYGAKAQEVLGFVRGRDFRHEKTKKKRGSYRGGTIGLQSHSIKFENSDED